MFDRRLEKVIVLSVDVNTTQTILHSHVLKHESLMVFRHLDLSWKKSFQSFHPIIGWFKYMFSVYVCICIVIYNYR